MPGRHHYLLVSVHKSAIDGWAPDNGNRHTIPAHGTQNPGAVDRTHTESRCLMETADTPLSRQVTIVNELGLHARSAAQIAAVAREAESGVWIDHAGESADATSIIDILTLACTQGTSLTLRIESPSDMNILDRLVELVRNGFGE